MKFCKKGSVEEDSKASNDYGIDIKLGKGT